MKKPAAIAPAPRIVRRLDADLAQAAAAHREREESIEDVEVLDEGIVAMRDHILPLGAVGLARRSAHAHQAEIARLPVGSDDEVVAEMLDLVFVIAFVRQEDLEFERRIVGVRVAPFRGHRAFHVDENEALGFRFGNAGVEAQVRLLEYQRHRAADPRRARAS